MEWVVRRAGGQRWGGWLGEVQQLGEGWCAQLPTTEVGRCIHQLCQCIKLGWK